jgi:hypothetical protein
VLGHLGLLATDRRTAELAWSLGAAYGVEAADAVHLASAVVAGTDAGRQGTTRIAVEFGISVHAAPYVAATRASRSHLVSCDVRDLVSKGLAVLPAAAVGRQIAEGH